MARALLVGPECRAVSSICLVGLDRRRRDVETAVSGTDGRCRGVVGDCVRLLCGRDMASGYGVEGLLRPLLGVAALALSIAVFVTVTVAGRFGDRVTDLAGGWTSLTRAQAALSAVYEELVASPPLSHYIDKRACFSLLLAAYVRDCISETERLLVLWFEPEIYYYSDRLMAQRHLVFPPTWANGARTDDDARANQSVCSSYCVGPEIRSRWLRTCVAPGVVDYVQREYRQAATVTDDGEEYLIFARRSRPEVRRFGPGDWPCFVRATSPWSRVGHLNE